MAPKARSSKKPEKKYKVLVKKVKRNTLTLKNMMANIQSGGAFGLIDTKSRTPKRKRKGK